MQIVVRGKNISVTPQIKRYLEKKLSRLERYFETPLSLPAQVNLSVERGRHIVEVTVPLNGVLLRGQEETDNVYAAIDLVVDKLGKQVDKYKTRLWKRFQKLGGVKPWAEGMAEDEEPEEPPIVKTKRFHLKPISPEEAVMEMNLLGHDFYVFTNVDTETINVVYRRRDGKYGLIEPEA